LEKDSFGTKNHLYFLKINSTMLIYVHKLASFNCLKLS
jgi:hypothetical protein